jgi:hypothetical protein
MRKHIYLVLLVFGCALGAACRTPTTPDAPPPEVAPEPQAASGSEQAGLKHW